MLARISRGLLSLAGWQIIGTLPTAPSYVIIVAPHTSNWDFIVGITARSALQLRASFLAKHTLFVGPLGMFLRWCGGKAVDRRVRQSQVAAAVKLFAKDSNFKLAITPEGTRGNFSRWKTGFYHIARNASVPIFCIGLDYQQKTVVLKDAFMPSDNIENDMAEIIKFFRTIKGLHPKTLPDFSPDKL